MSTAAHLSPRRPDQFDVEMVRRDFPGLQQTVHGQPLAYLDNAATTQKPRAVVEALSRYYVDDCANVHRAVYAQGERATRRYEAARRTVQRFLGAARAEEIVFVRGATEAINLVAHGLRPRLSAGDLVLVSQMEHHSNIVPWQLACEASGAEVRPIPMTASGDLDLDAYAELLGPRVRMVAVAHVSNALGTIHPVAEMVELAHAHGALVLVDGAQAVPHLPVDVQALACDFYAFSGHKVYGPTGIGALYGRYELLDGLPPYQGGGDMIRQVTFAGTTYAPLPHRLEAGTPHIAGAIGLGAAIDYLAGVGHEVIGRHERELLAYATRRLSDIPGLRIFGQPRSRAAVLSFALAGVHPHDIATIADQGGVAIRAGHHCAQPVWAHYGVPAATRASLALYNNQEDVDRLARTLARVQEVFAR
jgi:cysteine desulfurase/selenocysteine lyase